MSYSINQEYAIFDENMEVVDWFDTLEEAEEYIEQLERDGINGNNSKGDKQLQTGYII